MTLALARHSHSHGVIEPGSDRSTVPGHRLGAPVAISDKLAQIVWKECSSRKVVTGDGSPYQQGLDVKLAMTLAALAVAAAAGLATAAPAGAAVTSASLTDATATLNLDDADDNVTVSVSDGLLVHGQKGVGLNSGAD